MSSSLDAEGFDNIIILNADGAQIIRLNNEINESSGDELEAETRANPLEELPREIVNEVVLVAHAELPPSNVDQEAQIVQTENINESSRLNINSADNEDNIASGSQQTIPISLVQNVSQRTENNDPSVRTPSPAKKRKRLADTTPKLNDENKLDATTVANYDSENDDGCTCPICLDKWEMTGDHRLVSLRCGHLFGEICIKRWLTESGHQSGTKVCPQCKAKVTNRDIRHLYAKRVRAVDRSEEHELRKTLEISRQKVQSLEMEISVLKMREATTERRILALEAENSHLKLTLCSRPKPSAVSSGITVVIDLTKEQDISSLKSYKLFLEHNIPISRDDGCRVMAYSRKMNELFVSQKSANTLFPGYGVRVLSTSNFRPLQFIHLTTKELRDISFSADEQMFACTSFESSAKLYDFRMRETTTIGPLSENLKFWSCAMGDSFNANTLYLGAQQGSTSVVDMRFPNASLTCHEVNGDLSSVFGIAVIPRSEEFPLGGFCVCKLQSVWFYENSSNETEATTYRLDIEGPFLAMSFEPTQQFLVLTTRKSIRYIESRIIVGKIKKIDSHVVFEPQSTFIGAKNTVVMTRGCQIALQYNTLFAAFIQDTKQLALFDIRRQTRLQSLPVSDLILDTCPIYTARDTYVAALTTNKCRIYKLNET